MKSRIKAFLLLFVALGMILAACAQVSKVEPTSGEELQSSGSNTGKCLRDTDQTRLLVNVVQNYCVQYPAGYDIAYPNESEVMLIQRSMVNVTDPSAHIEVQPSEGMTVEQAADKLVADYSVPGMEVKRTSLTLGGEQAIMLDGLSGQEVNRQVVVIHNDRLYHLLFLPMDESQAETYKQAQALYETVIRSFNFRPDTNVCPDCPEPTQAANDQTSADPQSGSINGWVWHDQCDSGQDGQPAPASTPNGCVKEDSPIGSYHADGVLAVDEPLIEGVVVSLGKGACPSTGLAEMSTITTDLSFSFTGLSAGIYCVSIDPQREPNFSILRPGVWTYPAISQSVISTTVALDAGEYKGMVNFGWDDQFKP